MIYSSDLQVMRKYNCTFKRHVADENMTQHVVTDTMKSPRQGILPIVSRFVRVRLDYICYTCHVVLSEYNKIHVIVLHYLQRMNVKFV